MWLCGLMAKIVSVKSVHTFLGNGILDIANIKFIIGERNEKFPQRFYDKYMRLLYRFQIACRIDEHRILVPSKLPEGKPDNIDKDIDITTLLKRYHFFTWIPYGFWSRFMSRLLLLMKEMLSPNEEVKSQKSHKEEESIEQADSISYQSELGYSYIDEIKPTTPGTNVDDHNGFWFLDGALCIDDGTVVTDDCVVLSDVRDVVTDDHVVVTDHDAVATNNATVISDDGIVVTDHDAVTTDNATVISDDDTIVTEDSTAVTDFRIILSDGGVAVSNRNKGATHRAVVPDDDHTTDTCGSCDVTGGDLAVNNKVNNEISSDFVGENMVGLNDVAVCDYAIVKSSCVLVDDGDSVTAQSSDVADVNTGTDQDAEFHDEVVLSDLHEQESSVIEEYSIHHVPYRVSEDNPQLTACIDQQKNPVILPRNTDEGDLFTDCSDVGYLLDNRYITCWEDGVVFNHPQLYFSVQQVPSVKKDRQAIETRVSKSPLGYRVLGFIVDHFSTLLREWYPGLSGNDGENAYVMQYIACPICTSIGINPAHLFDIQTAFHRIYNSTCDDSFLPCIRSHSPQVINVEDLCPELVFKDLPKSLQLDRLQLQCKEQEDRFISIGSSGTIYKGQYKEKPVAVKRYYLDGNNMNDLDVFYEIRQEVVILSRLQNHPNIVEFLGVSTKPKLCAVMELADCGSLHDMLDSREMKTNRVLYLKIAQQVMSGLVYMHSRNIIYRDMKSSNILLFSLDPHSPVNVKLTDFGTANFLSPSGMIYTTGTPSFMAPEMLGVGSSDEYTPKVDIYSSAMVLYQMITLHQPFQHLPSYKVLQATKRGEKPIYCDVSRSFYGLLTMTELMIKMWHRESVHRPAAKDVLKQLKDVSFQLLYGKRALEVPQNPRYMCFVPSVSEVWALCDDREGKY